MSELMENEVYKAAVVGDQTIFSIKNHVELLRKTSQNNNIIHIAAQHGQIDFIKAALNNFPLIRTCESLICDRNLHGNTPVGNNSANPLQLQLFVDHITGHLGDEMEQTMAAEIVHVVIAGNSMELPKGHFNGQNLGPKDQSSLFEPIKVLDISLSQIAAGVSLDIMPGPNDPANASLPQQPLHRCLFPGTSVFNTFRSCTNPHSFELDNIRFVGTSGQNIDDLAKYSDAKDNLEFIERTLRWRHIAPTTPNTLGCYPYTDKDPFLLESCPHVYFIGNQSKFESRLIEGHEGQVTRIISIPKFCETGVAVMVNLRTLECNALSFEAQFS